MHRVLSYQTAMRANNERDVREYVTKRTCVSLILSIAFFTLISGFLLGKFVADRQHHIKHLRDRDIKFIQDLYTTREDLLKAIQNWTKLLSNQSNTSDTINSEIFSIYFTCMKQSTSNYKDDSLDDSIIQFIDNQNQLQIECLKAVQNNLENLTLTTTN